MVTLANRAMWVKTHQKPRTIKLMTPVTVKFNASRICIVSDFHIGVHQNSQLWHNIAIKWAKWLKKELESKGVTDIMMCGDLFHYRDEVAVNTMHVVNQILTLWKDFNIIMLVGNHDAYYKDRSDVNSLSLLSGWPNITIISKLQEVDIFGKRVVFCPWGVDIKNIPPGDIIFGHMEIESFKFNHYRTCEDGFRSTDLLSKSRLIISGHFHHREEREYTAGKILYVGNPFQMDFGDVNCTKGYYIFDFNTIKYEFFENKISPKHFKLYLSQLLKNNDITSNVKGNFIKFYVDQQTTGDDIDALLKMLFKLKPLSLNVDHTMVSTYGIEEDTNYDFSGVDVPTAIEEFVNLMELDNKKDIIDYTLELYKRCK